MEYRVSGSFDPARHLQLCGYYLRLVLVAPKGASKQPGNFPFSHSRSGSVVGVFVPWRATSVQLHSRGASDCLCRFLSGMRGKTKVKLLKKMIIPLRDQQLKTPCFESLEDLFLPVASGKLIWL